VSCIDISTSRHDIGTATLHLEGQIAARQPDLQNPPAGKILARVNVVDCIAQVPMNPQPGNSIVLWIWQSWMLPTKRGMAYTALGAGPRTAFICG
jgi:hypothetical protein